MRSRAVAAADTPEPPPRPQRVGARSGLCSTAGPRRAQAAATPHLLGTGAPSASACRRAPTRAPTRAQPAGAPPGAALGWAFTAAAPPRAARRRCSLPASPPPCAHTSPCLPPVGPVQGQNHAALGEDGAAREPCHRPGVCGRAGSRPTWGGQGAHPARTGLGREGRKQARYPKPPIPPGGRDSGFPSLC